MMPLFPVIGTAAVPRILGFVVFPGQANTLDICPPGIWQHSSSRFQHMVPTSWALRA